MATEILKSNGRPHICVPLQPLVPGLAQFICETSRDCDFMETVVSEQPGLDTEELYNRYCSSHRLLFIKKLPEDVFDINNQENLLSVFKPADKTPERLHQTLPGGVTSAAPGDFNPYGSGELLLGPVLHQPKEQHEGTGGSVSCSGRRVTTATLWLLQVRNAPVSYVFFSLFLLVLFTHNSIMWFQWHSFFFIVLQRAACQPRAFTSASPWTLSGSGSSLHHPSKAAVL